MPEFECSDGSRFEGDFALRAVGTYVPTEAEAELIGSLASQMDRMAAEISPTDDLKAELEELREERCKSLREWCDGFAALPAGPDRDKEADRIVVESWRLDGAYASQRHRRASKPFEIELEVEPPGAPATDLIIKTRDVRIPPEKQRLKLELDKVCTVLKAALGASRSGRGGIVAGRLGAWWRMIFGDAGAAGRAHKLNDYLRSLAGIARVGLMNSDSTQTPFAAEALVTFKEEVVAREATHIKNAYVWRLGVAAAIAIAICTLLYFAIPKYFVWAVPYSNFCLLWAGAAAGTWLSFSLRRPVLQFTDLALLEEDRLRPEFRILFVLVLTTVVGLFFWTGMVAVEIGAFKTSAIKLVGAERLPEVPILIGMLCGIAERSMSTVVSRRAEDFATGVGGKTPAPST